MSKTCKECGRVSKSGKQQRRQLCNELERIMKWDKNWLYYNSLNQDKLLQLVNKLKKETSK